MKIFVTACAVAGVLALSSGTASAQNPTYCHDQAIAFANQYANPVAGGVGGGIVGAVGGGILGKVLGNSKKDTTAGALIGGTAGVIVGASSAKKKHQRLYNEEYYRCMNTPAAAPAPAPAPVYYNIPPAGSPEWNYQCSLKYKSFQPYTGTFQPYRPYPGAPLPPRRVCVLP
jgi:uncharacterized protein YcfJ